MRFTLLWCSFLFVPLLVMGQTKGDETIERKELNRTIVTISKLLQENYISESIGEKMAQHIKHKHRENEYADLSYKALGKALTADFREVSGDIHMSAYYNLKKDSPEESLFSEIGEDYGARNNYGSTEVKILEGNIGYYKISNFTLFKFFEEAKEVTQNALSFLRNTDALIIDVRDNPGGFEAIVAFLVSHFVNTDVVDLQEYYCRYSDSKSKISVQKGLSSVGFREMPIYIMINKGTGSAAESFAYIMKHLERATLVGESTAGAGNGSTFFQVADEFRIQISVCETINQVTKTSWEKTGVIPDIMVDNDSIYSKTLEFARFRGKNNREVKDTRAKKAITQLEQLMEKPDLGLTSTEISESIKICNRAGVSQNTINTLGYKYLREGKNKVAEIIFKTNMDLFLNSPNTYDSYAEALFANGNRSESVEYYRKAIDLAKEQNHPDTEIYEQNLERILMKE